MVSANSASAPEPFDTFHRRAIRHAFEDGAIDLVVGVFTLMVGAATQRRTYVALAVVYLGVLALAWKPLHDRLTAGRTGYAEQPEKSVSGFSRFHLFAAASVAGSLFFWLFPFGAGINPSDRLTLFLVAMAGLLMAVGAATMTRFVRGRPIVPDEASDGR
jgi:hypothetical protein